MNQIPKDIVKENMNLLFKLISFRGNWGNILFLWRVGKIYVKNIFKLIFNQNAIPKNFG